MSHENNPIKQEIEEIELTDCDHVDNYKMTMEQMQKQMLEAMQKIKEEGKKERQAIREDIGAMQQNMMDVWLADSATEPANDNGRMCNIKTEADANSAVDNEADGTIAQSTRQITIEETLQKQTAKIAQLETQLKTSNANFEELKVKHATSEIKVKELEIKHAASVAKNEELEVKLAALQAEVASVKQQHCSKICGQVPTTKLQDETEKRESVKPIKPETDECNRNDDEDQPEAQETIADAVNGLVSKAREESDDKIKLHRAAEKGDNASINYLLEKGADVDGRDDDGHTPLMIACKHGMASTVEELLFRGADVATTSFVSGETALHWAAGRGHDDIVNILLAQGADMNTRNKYGNTPLATAFQHKKTSTMELLLSKGANADTISQEDNTILHMAVEQGDGDMLILLLKHGADINGKDKDGHTPLILASDQGDTLTAKLLLSKGACVSATCVGGMTALHLAAGQGHDEIVKFLLEHNADVDCRDEDGRTPLISACARGRDSTAKLLLREGSNTHLEDFFGKTALEVALEKNHTKTVSLLQQWQNTGPVFTAEKFHGKTNEKNVGYLHHQEGSSTSTDVNRTAYAHVSYQRNIILTSGKTQEKHQEGEYQQQKPKKMRKDPASKVRNITRVTIPGKQDMSVKCVNQDEEEVKKTTTFAKAVNVLLSKAVSDFNERCLKSENGKKDLHKAVKEGNEARIIFLLSRGVDVDGKDDKGWTPLMITAALGRESTAELLLSEDANVATTSFEGKTALHFAAHKGENAIVSILLDHGADVNSRDNDGSTPLVFASTCGRTSTVKQLLYRGADTSIASVGNKTALHLAAEQGHDDVVMGLLKNQADATLRDLNGCTPLISAAEHGRASTVKLILKECNINIECKDNRGRTALTVAQENNHVEVVTVLKQWKGRRRPHSNTAEDDDFDKEAKVPRLRLKRARNEETTEIKASNGTIYHMIP